MELNTREFLRKNRNLFLVRIFVFVLLPTLCAALYAYVYATPRYVSEFQIVYHDTTQSGGAGGALSGLLGSSSSVDMTRVISAFVSSGTMLDLVDKKVDLRREYSNPSVDWWDRMPADASKEKFLSYLNSRVSVYEQTGGFLVVDVEAFSPQRAQVIANAIAEAADEMVNDLNNRPKVDTVNYTEGKLRRFREALDEATATITRFREAHSEYNYGDTVSQLSGVVGGLQTALAQTQSQLGFARSVMSENSPGVTVLKSKITSLQSQIDEEKNHFGSPSSLSAGQESSTGSQLRSGTTIAKGASQSAGTESNGQSQPTGVAAPNNSSYSQIMARYAELQLAQDLAKSSYAAAEQAYEGALLDLAKKTAYVVNFVPPSLPQKAEAPNGLYIISWVFVLTFIAYYIGSLVMGLLRDQLGL